MNRRKFLAALGVAPIAAAVPVAGVAAAASETPYEVALRAACAEVAWTQHRPPSARAFDDPMWVVDPNEWRMARETIDALHKAAREAGVSYFSPHYFGCFKSGDWAYCLGGRKRVVYFQEPNLDAFRAHPVDALFNIVFAGAPSKSMPGMGAAQPWARRIVLTSIAPEGLRGIRLFHLPA